MTRLQSTMLWDVRLQFRNGFYYASLVIVVVCIGLLSQIPATYLTQIFPAVILGNLVVGTFYFLGGMVLLEKGEGTLEAQIVTPLRPWEYLNAKVLSLGMLALFETLLVIVLVSGIGFNWLLLVLGVLFLIAINTLYGFVVVARYDSISEFLLPSVIWTLGYSLPLLYYFDIWRSWLMFLHPIQAPLVLMQAAFEPVPGWQIVYGLLYSILWVGVAFYFSQRAFYRFVVTKQGVRKK